MKSDDEQRERRAPLPGLPRYARRACELVRGRGGAPCLCALALGAAGVLGARPARAADPAAPSYQLEVGPSVGYVTRQTERNPSEAHFGGIVAPGLLFRLSAAPWLRVSARYLRALAVLDLPPGSLGTQAHALESPTSHITTIDGFVHPTWNMSSRAHLWATLGLGWASVAIPPIRTDEGRGSTLRSRGGVFLEVPVGMGIALDILPGWLTLSYDMQYAPTFGSSGDVYQEDPYINGQGQRATLGAIPRFTSSFYQLLTLSLAM